MSNTAFSDLEKEYAIPVSFPSVIFVDRSEISFSYLAKEYDISVSLPSKIYTDSFGISHLDDLPSKERVEELSLTSIRSADEPSVAIPVRVTRSIQRVLDEALLKYSFIRKKSSKGPYVPPVDPIEIDDD
ncbi:hypothetical protein KY290_013459 [Solanum tuberosum]|uniref:Uncharacterized protein n=1 Tax=Solanum tuberosum TaxID=4113 RepID=A0ABQ7VM17_SOLTU|nr:hypothetical protein KY289_013578 [Solanum tuberosum]KAH0716886.1 hypothetical protein KY285_012917 [Solanum tuberosum]KAH0769478.1 hypothetical protein KY290_013459 [Solanum tuberosum]